MKMRGKAQIEAKQQRIRRLVNMLSTESMKTHRELAARFGVSESTIQNNLKAARAIIEEHFRETLAEDLGKRMLQYEVVMEKAYEDYERSRKKLVRCRNCRGKGFIGKDVEKRDCSDCEGDGWIWDQVPGNPRYLLVVLKTIEDICKLRGHYTKAEEERQKEEKQLEERPMSPELSIEVRRVLFQLKHTESSPDNKDAVDVEFGPSNEKGKEE